MRLIVTGHVQGVGFRPTMARLAHSLRLAGEIRNSCSGVEIILEGEAEAVDQFVNRLRFSAPKDAAIDRVQVAKLPPLGRSGFTIEPGDCTGPIQAIAPLDLKVCHQCLCDIADLANRRYRYPFTSCTQCGPRYSILEDIPYQRSATSMVGFPLCAECQQEFDSPRDERFHAETIACPRCGPVCTFIRWNQTEHCHDEDPIEAGRSAILRGEIVALRGLGGYQLLVDATNSAAVTRLRVQKQRPAKPLAVLVDSLERAGQLFALSAAAREALTAATGPIVLARPKANSRIAPEVAPGLGEIGVMLPTTPLHFLIAQGMPPLVATSGNHEGEPIAFGLEGGRSRLGQIADCFVDHNRPIRRPIDDGVVRIIAEKPVTLRLARGQAPLSLDLAALSRGLHGTPILAVGGQQNNAIAIWNGYQAVLGPHVGDLDEVTTCERWHDHRRDLCSLMGAAPAVVAHDLHPDYSSSRWAIESELPTMVIQHHHAHIVAGMLEHHWLAQEVLGIAWDGTGLGDNGELWGGEFLRATASGFTRVARLRPFALPGGEWAIRKPWRTALSLLSEVIGVERAVDLLRRRGYEPAALQGVSRLLDHPHLMARTSSVGRLFDAVAVLAFPKAEISDGISQYEGHFAMLLESACQDLTDTNADSSYPLPLVNSEIPELDWRPLIGAIVSDLERDVAPSTISHCFHTALAKAIAHLSDLHADLPIVLGGGVFQNRILTERVLQLLTPMRREIGAPGMIPPGDGGLAAGQLAIAMSRIAANIPAGPSTQKAPAPCV
jgi:hydrogenase maturation protein HypF